MFVMNVSGFDRMKTAKIYEAVYFYLKTLLIDQYGEDSLELLDSVEVNVDGMLHGDPTPLGESVGVCTRVDDKEYDIKIMKYLPPEDDFWRILAHECVHVKQYITHELGEGFFDLENGFLTRHTFWKGEKHKLHYNDYYDWPWEKEAYELEITLVRKFYEKYGR